MRVLFICRSNSGRSQMAEAFFNRLSKRNNAISAGVEVEAVGNTNKPINPKNVEVMAEIGYDLSRCTRKQLTMQVVEGSDLIITMIDKKMLPDYLQKSEKVIYWDIDNEVDKSDDARIIVRDKIKRHVVKLIKELG